jgi:predicted dehydrogenase
VCDVRRDQLDAAAERLGASEKYADYGEMLDRSKLDAVVIGSPMQFHAPQAVQALDRGIHVLSEVTAGVSVEECRTLVLARKRSKAVYMMAENYTYMKPNVLVKEIVRRGLFGEVYYAEGEYLHELKELNEVTKWRRRWQTGIDGITYGTHSLGPILQWMAGDRVVRVSCEGSGHHYRDPRGDLYENQDTCVMLAKTARGGLIKIRVDMLSDRPHSMTNYSLQGSRGCYESARGRGERGKIWLADLCPDRNAWMDLSALEADYMPEIWRNPPEEALRAGHGGGDFFEVFDFVNAILGKAPCPIGIHEAMDMTLPGLVSQASIARGGEWLEVPDSRTW